MDRLGIGDMDVELFVLKCHLIVERELYWLLAHRLDIAERHLPPLTYFPLAKLSLGGDEYRDTLVSVLALNDLRNEFGHELEEDQLQSKYEVFCQKREIFWPGQKVAGQPANLQGLRDTSVRVAAFSVIGAVWAHIAELSLAKNLYESEAEAEHARQALAENKRRASQLRQQQILAGKAWQLFFST